MIKRTLYVTGMTCGHCEKTIEKALKTVNGIEKSMASSPHNKVVIHYNEASFDLKDAHAAIENAGYEISEKTPSKVKYLFTTLALMLISTMLVIRYSGSLSFDFLPNIRQNMGYGTLFVVGLLTSVHCIAMCGGINISQCQRYATERPTMPSLLYNLGRVTSYTIIGGIIGGIGSVLSFNGQTRGYVTLFVSALMILMSNKMLKLFDVKLPRIQLPLSVRKQIVKLSGKGPFFVGLANGFMPCGPLQSMQLYALGTGSVLRGALSMFYFSLGTFPLMFALGFVSTLMNHKFSKNIMKYSGMLIFILGMTMFTRGASLAGVIIPFQYNGEVVAATMIEDNLQEVIISLEANAYSAIKVKKDVPVRFVIQADSDAMNGCNNPVTIPSLNIEQTLYPGENIIEFTPESEGKIAYTCWMGMINSYIDVVE